MLQAKRSRIQFLMSLAFFNLSCHTMAVESTQPLTEISTSNLPGCKMQTAREAVNLTAICKLSTECVGLNISQPYMPPQPAKTLALPS
jgi:hypothetical protein